MKPDINNFMLKGLFTSYCIKDLQTEGLLRNTDLYYRRTKGA